MITLYHRTEPGNAAEILRTKRMISMENTGEVYFSNVRDNMATGYGDAVVCIQVPDEMAVLDDEFPDGELHYRVKVADLRPEHFMEGRSSE